MTGRILQILWDNRLLSMLRLQVILHFEKWGGIVDFPIVTHQFVLLFLFWGIRNLFCASLGTPFTLFKQKSKQHQQVNCQQDRVWIEAKTPA